MSVPQEPKHQTISPHRMNVAYLVVANPSARNNLGTIIRCAAGFDVEELIIVGAPKWSTHGAHGSHKAEAICMMVWADEANLQLLYPIIPTREPDLFDPHVKCRCFNDWNAAATFLRDQRGCDICGIVQSTHGTTVHTTALAADTIFSSTDGVNTQRDTNQAINRAGLCPEAGAGEASLVADRSEGGSKAASEGRPQEQPGDQSEKKGDRVSTALRHRPFRRSTAFLVGHRNRLEDKASAVCDFLVHVDQVKDSPMELESPVTTSIALHHFTAWARYEERHFTGEKFNVDKELARYRPPAGNENAKAKERARLREEMRSADPLEDPLGVGEGYVNASAACGGVGFGEASGVGGEEEEQGDY